ncbi:hypothetical protein UCRPC4_g00065 [Phaeomoniella chlamydospora]|uniref:T6SS Phospholipase effector Tle1-like catalytic domain-containing protein n=1 Tax=Phaeomoniella chlamydospora TaxID=158046 RepID=A0A0G2H1S9_PHACM|nr:hypothetical protein UCRPC4_g00065 [Phaeomoniella chlamydospora]
MGGYKFLMKFYETGDDIYIFGFSRGAYIARFLAEMLDYIGLLEPGNEEMCEKARFAWKAFAQWQMRLDSTEKEREDKRKLFRYLSAFRDTFSRPVRRIRFLGLFDTVNSVPRFESSFMQRSKFPYTAKSSAIVIRHAVGIDERRAKFRQDLVGEKKNKSSKHQAVLRGRPFEKAVANTLHIPQKPVIPHDEPAQPNQRYRRKSHQHRGAGGGLGMDLSRSPARSISPIPEKGDSETHSLRTTASADGNSLIPPRRGVHDDLEDDDEADEAIPQDTQEVWFPGCHADIGGGWPLNKSKGEHISLSHGPLVWMVREARRAGLRFDEDKMAEMGCLDPDELDEATSTDAPEPPSAPVFHLQVDSGSPQATDIDNPINPGKNIPHTAAPSGGTNNFHQNLTTAFTSGLMHDSLAFSQGTPTTGVIAWNFMEYLPFRRMDLMPDNSWRSIRWPLPKGEVRDIPADALIHHSAIRRMEKDENYRPGNLIVGGGGRGIRKAPEEYGIGNWDVVREKGHLVGECVVRRRRAEQNGKGNGYG